MLTALLSRWLIWVHLLLRCLYFLWFLYWFMGSVTQSERAVNWLTEFSSAERKGLCLSFNPMSNLGLPYADRGRGRGWVGQVAKFHSSARSGNSSDVSCEWRMRWGGSPSSYRYAKYSDTWWWEFTLEVVGPQAPPLLAVLHLSKMLK